MRVLVLGGGGFIGTHLVRALVASGVEVSVLDRGTPDNSPQAARNVKYFQGVLSDAAIASEAIRGCDVVCHLISTTVPSTSNLDPVADIEGNLISTVKLLELMRRQGVPKIVYLSSGGTVYGDPTQDHVSEEHPLAPICSYGVVKVAIERYLGMYQRLYGIRSTVLRASNPYGPRQSHSGVQGLIGTCLRKIEEGNPMEVWGDGTVVRDYVFIDDLVRLIASAVGSEQTGIFNAGSGQGHSVNEVLAVIREAVNKPFQAVYKQGRGFDVGRIVLDISRAQTAFSWSPQVELRRGIISTWDWMRSRGIDSSI